MMIFTDKVELYIPPRKGRRHVLRVLRELFYHEPEGRGTDVALALDYLNHVIRRRAVVFLVSDFMTPDFVRPLSVAGRRHDLVAIRMGDRREVELPPLGYVEFEDAETGERMLVNTSNKRFRSEWEALVTRTRTDQDRAFRRSTVDVIDIQTNEAYERPLMRFFKERERRF